ncbi:transposon Tf2-6 polyprotein [Trichonephila clavipes]|nr:transposon Tf2-6 polyprotein [Trichonephila clavipes]
MRMRECQARGSRFLPLDESSRFCGLRPQADHIIAPLVSFLKGIRNKKRPKRNVKIKPEEVLEWTDEATTAFELVKQTLAHAPLLHHPMPNAPLSIQILLSMVH